jgi:rod shape-determining protein MreD
MQTVKVACLAGVLLLIQMTILDSVRLWGLRPDLIFILVLFVCLYTPDQVTAFTGAWTAGLMQDLVDSGTLGHSALIYMGVGLGIVWIREFVFRNFTLNLLLIALGGSFIVNFICALVNGVYPFLGLGTSLYTAAITPPAILLLHQLNKARI